ncbi:MAG: hypothetical protein WC648_01080 [Candidatus Paceibacterota bacterium]|jgi:hypothetical protein
MARLRVINTRFWNDDYIARLDPLERYLFLYFLTNPATDISGIYELPLRTVAAETGIEADMLKMMMDRFATDSKIYYFNGWVFVKNFSKHQTMNPKIKTGIELSLKRVPTEVLSHFGIEQPYSIDSLSHSNSNSNSNPNPNSNPNSKLAPQAVQEISVNDCISLFEPINPTFERLYSNKSQRSAMDRLLKKFGGEKMIATLRELPKLINKPYAPTITTPIQLESKLGSLISFYYKQKSNVTTIIGL